MEAYLTLPCTKLNHVYFDAVLFTRSRMSASATLGGSFLITTFVLSMTILQSPTLYQCLVCVTSLQMSSPDPRRLLQLQDLFAAYSTRLI